MLGELLNCPSLQGNRAFQEAVKEVQNAPCARAITICVKNTGRRKTLFKMTKKVTAIVLALILGLSSMITAFAEEVRNDAQTEATT